MYPVSLIRQIIYKKIKMKNKKKNSISNYLFFLVGFLSFFEYSKFHMSVDRDMRIKKLYHFSYE